MSEGDAEAQIVSLPALAYARQRGLHALVVARDGRILHEEFGEKYTATTAHPLYSGTKSFWGVVALAAQRDGILSLDERVADTFGDWSFDARKSGVTLRQLLQLTSGHGFGGLGSAVPTYPQALSIDLKNPPGRTFTYSGVPLQVFGAVLACKLESRKLTPQEFLRQRILDPAGIRVARWRTLRDGSNPLPTGAFMSAIEWLGYGRYVCDHRDELAECFQGSAANPHYGLGFWLGARGAPEDLAYASGAGGQGMYVVPSCNVVIVHFGNSPSFKHEAFLKRYFF